MPGYHENSYRNISREDISIEGKGRENNVIEIETLYENIINRVDTKNISIIGIDGLGGAGKSTISENLCQKLEDNNYHPIWLHIDDFIHV